MSRSLRQELRRAAQEETDRLLAALPPAIRARLEGLPIAFEPVPGPARRRAGIEPDLMGVFLGRALGEPPDADIEVSPEIILFLDNIWDEADGDPARYRREVRQTLLHEIGHYLGLDEDGLELRGLE